MTKQQLSLTVVLLFVMAVLGACGGGNNDSAPPPPPPPSGGFALEGSFFFVLNGIDANGVFRVAGVFNADGNGRITGGIEDYTQGSTVVVNTAFSGTYNLNTSTGVGTATLSAPSGTTTLQFVMSGQNFAYINEYDPYANASGYILKRDPTAFSNAALNGIYVFNFSGDETGYGPIAAVGAFAVDGAGNVTAGAEDLNEGGIYSPDLPLTGTYQIGADGRGVASLDNGTYALPIVCYVIDANTITFLSSDSTVGAFGRAEKQSGMAGTPTLSGGYAFSENGSSTVGGIATVGRFAADSAGNISAGVLDEVEEGTPYTNAAFSGTYQMDTNGRVQAALRTEWGTWNHVLWFINPGRAFVLYTDSDRVESGVVEKQQATFSPGSVNGYFGFALTGYDTSDYIDTAGVMWMDGNGGLTFEQWLNVTGTTSHFSTGGTYSVESNGRGTATPGDGSHLQFYLVSSSKAFLLQTDQDTTVSGSAQKQ